jgi:predicted nucleotidyltransferase
VSRDMTTPQIAIPYDQIAAFCQRNHIRWMALFGSVLRDDFRPDSDVDVLVEFDDDFRLTIRTLMAMEEELRSLFGREVDLGERKLVESDRNYIRRKHILNNLQVIYERR